MEVPLCVRPCVQAGVFGCSSCSSSDCRAGPFACPSLACCLSMWLSDSHQRAIASWRLQQEHSCPPGSDFPLDQYSLSRQLACEKSGLGKLEEAAWQLNSPLRMGSLFPGGQDIVCLSQIFFFFWEVKDRDVSRNFDPNYS